MSDPDGFGPHDRPFDPWPPVGLPAIMNELIALVSGTAGRTLTSAMIRRTAALGIGSPVVAQRQRHRRALELLRHLAAALRDAGLDGWPGQLAGRDVTGRGEAINMLERAIAVHRVDPRHVTDDIQLSQRLAAVQARQPAVPALRYLRDELLAPGRGGLGPARPGGRGGGPPVTPRVVAADRKSAQQAAGDPPPPGPAHSDLGEHFTKPHPVGTLAKMFGVHRNTMSKNLTSGA